MRADKVAATNDLVILGGNFHSRSTYNGMASEFDHLPVEADIGLGTMPFTRAVTTKKVKCYEVLSDPVWLGKWAAEADTRAGRLGPIMGDNVHNAHKTLVHTVKSLIDVIPTRSITEEPGFVRAHKAAADVIAGAHRTVLAEIDASDASEESKSVDRTYLADSIQSQYRALAEEQKVKFIGRAHAMAPSKLYALFTKSERPNKPHVVRDGIRLNDKQSAAVFQETFAAKCRNPDVDIDGILNTAPSDWKGNTFFQQQTTRKPSSYADVIRERQKQILLGGKLPWDDEHCDDLPITAEEVHAAIMTHPASATPDVDGIPLCILQAIPLGALHCYMARLFTRCRDIGIVPRGWKLQQITPAYKGSPKPVGEASSYRPISITSYFSRTWERVVVLRLEQMLARLCPAQFGYLRARTPEQMVGLIQRTLERITETKTKDTQSHFVAAALSFDCTDAFCKITPAMVKKALLRIGVDIKTVEVITDWMTDRMQSVKVGDFITAYIIVEAGLPQGSVLGPLLWDVVFDDLNVFLYRRAPGLKQDLLPEHVLEVSFADDLEMIVGASTTKTAARRLEDWAAHAVAWLRAAGIPISDKTKASFFHRNREAPKPDELTMFAGKHRNLTVAIGTEGLKILGIHFSSDGTCKKHLEVLIEHLEGVHENLRAIAKLVHPQKVRQIYAQQGLTKLRYGASAVWQVETADYKPPHGYLRDPRGPVHKGLKDNLQSAHAKCARTIIGTNYSCNGDLALREAGLSTVDTFMQLQVARSHCLFKGRKGMEKAMLVGRQPLPLFEGLMAGDTEANHPSLVALPYHPGEAAIAMRNVGFIMGLNVKEPKRKAPPPFEVRAKMTKAELDAMLAAPKVAHDRLKKAENERRVMDLPEYDMTLATDASLSKKGGLERDRQKGTIRSGWGWELKGALNRTINSGQHRTASPPTIYTLEGYAGFMGLLGLEHAIRQNGDNLATPPDGRRWRILWKTDSRSIAEALRRGPLRQRELIAASLWEVLVRLVELGVDIDIMHVYSHVGDENNAAADALAGDPYASCPDRVIFTPRDAAALLEAKILAKEEAEFVNTGLRRYEGSKKFLEFPSMKRGDLRTLMQLRLGVCELLGGHLHGMPDPCPQCCAPGVLARGGLAVEHMFSCKEALALRTKHLGSPLGLYNPRTLWDEPRRALAYAKAFWTDLPVVAPVVVAVES